MTSADEPRDEELEKLIGLPLTPDEADFVRDNIETMREVLSEGKGPHTAGSLKYTFAPHPDAARPAGAAIPMAEVKANEAIGWFVEDGMVKQVMTIKPREIRVIGPLEADSVNHPTPPTGTPEIRQILVELFLAHPIIAGGDAYGKEVEEALAAISAAYDARFEAAVDGPETITGAEYVSRIKARTRWYASSGGNDGE